MGGNIPLEKLNWEKTFSYFCILKMSNIDLVSQHFFQNNEEFSLEGCNIFMEYQRGH